MSLNINDYIISNWGASQSRVMDWERDNVSVQPNGSVIFALERESDGSYSGGEWASKQAMILGTVSWTLQAAPIEQGAIEAMFLYQADWKDPRCEFDWEFVKNTNQVMMVVHMATPNGRISEAKTIDLGFDASHGIHTYDIRLDGISATYLVDGKPVGIFDKTDMESTWRADPVIAYTSIWADDNGWAGVWKGLASPMEMTLHDAQLRPGDLKGPRAILGDKTENTLSGTNGADLLEGRGANDFLKGGDGNDRLNGGDYDQGRDSLYGNQGSDHLQGGDGGDYIHGGMGRDILTGGVTSHDKGSDIYRDVFVFSSIWESQTGSADTIKDFNGADDISLLEIDANTQVSGNQAFVFGSSRGANSLWVVQTQNGVNVRADVNGDAAADLEIFLENLTLSELNKDDFIL